MKSLTYLLLALLLPCTLRAQQYTTEVFPSYSKTSNITYANNISVLSGSPATISLMCDIYEPSGITDTLARRPLIVLLHSGSFLPPYLNAELQGNREDSGLVFMCKSFARRGYVVANIDYRLGWNPAGSTVDIRRGTIIQATYRAIQDVKAAVRFFRKDAATNNTYRIDSNRVIVGGTYTGGLVAVNYAALQTQAQIAIPKFINSGTGQPYIDASIMGDLDGYGGNPTYNNPNNSPGYNGRPNFVFAFEAVVGDSTWITPGLPPIVSLHRKNNNMNSPYGNGIIYVYPPSPIPPQSVVDVSGSGIFMPLTNSKGNNACFRPNNFTDPYTQRAMAVSGGVEGLFPLVNDTAAVVWFDSVSAVTECQAYGVSAADCKAIYTKEAAGHTKAQSLLYIDTLMGYLNPRIVQCLSLRPTGVKEQAASHTSISFYPNPATGHITVSASNAIECVTIRDVTGKTQRLIKGQKQQILHLPLDGMPAGIYTLTVQTSKETLTKKLVLQ